VEAAKFLSEHKLEGRIINDLNSGSWLIWKGPQKVFIDGRLEVTREKFFSEYRITFNYKDGLKILIDKYKPLLILFDHSSSLKWYFQLRKMDEWRIIYLDEKFVIFARKDYATEYPQANIMKKISEIDIDTSLTESDVWAILKTKRQNKLLRFIEGLYKIQDYPYEIMEMGLFAYQSGNFRAAEILHLEFIKRTKGLYEAYFNLGSIYYRKKELNKSKYCYERVLEYNPNNKIAKDRVKELQKYTHLNP
jgi:tetratricopeptide (TPR) repeat protein